MTRLHTTEIFWELCDNTPLDLSGPKLVESFRIEHISCCLKFIILGDEIVSQSLKFLHCTLDPSAVACDATKALTPTALSCQ